MIFCLDTPFYIGYHIGPTNDLLDPMHIFKSVMPSIWDHMIRTRDSLGISEDLQNIGRMPKAWSQERPNGSVLLPHAPWT